MTYRKYPKHTIPKSEWKSLQKETWYRDDLGFWKKRILISRIQRKILATGVFPQVRLKSRLFRILDRLGY